MMRSTRERGFTVVEMLVSAGIVLVLIGVLIPAVGTARRRSKVTLCASNLRQVGQAVQAYRSEARRWPDACPIPSPFTAPGWPGSTRSLPAVLTSYLPPRSGVYRCPGDAEVFERCASQPNGFGVSYFYWTPVAPTPPDTTMLTDFQGYAGPLRTVDVGEFHPPRRGMNALRIDGSVEFGRANPAGP